ncbi:phosphatase PAP2 family protein [Streptomyces sp. NPDC048349]|uniref:phosphatase PAP2 family protein n=1 Tax=Streptomyces sp. NPDC048349 TaxID=3155486 RepID=UPI0034440F9F
MTSSPPGTGTDTAPAPAEGAAAAPAAVAAAAVRPDGSADGPARGRGPLFLGLLLLGAAALAAVVVRADVADPPFQALDDRWHTWMGGPHEGPFAAVASALDWFGGPFGAVVPLGLPALLVLRGRRVSAGFLLLAFLGGNLVVVQGLKHLVDRPRPADPLVRVDHGSFPSGHAATAALLVVVVGALLVPAARRRLWWAAGAAFTLAMMWSRTWLHAHWLSDTAAGAAAGAGAGLVVWWLLRPALDRERARLRGRVRGRRGAAAHSAAGAGRAG